MTTLRDVTVGARRLALTGDHEAAEALLAAGAVGVAEESDLNVLAEFAEACRDWGAETDEERALREVIRRSSGPDAVLRLLDLLQRRLNTLQDAEHLAVATECLRLGSAALDLVALRDEETRAHLHYCRGLRHIDLANDGQVGHCDSAASDIGVYIDWLMRSDSVPNHLQRENSLALAQVDLAEAFLLQGRVADAASALEGAIKVLEDAGFAGWMTEQAYSLLERAWNPDMSP